MTWTLLTLFLATAGTRSFSDERQLMDRRLETLRRILPDAPHPEVDIAFVRELADQARLTQVELSARPPQEKGGLGTLTLDLKATGRFNEIERFYRQVSQSPRLIDVESTTLNDAPGTIRVLSQVRLAYRPTNASLTVLPEGVRAAVAGVPKPQADAYLRDQALAFEKSQTIATWRRARRNPRLFLAELAAIVRERPVVLTQARLADEFSVRGLTVGDYSARALETRFERGFFRLSEFLMARQGACLRFEVRGSAPIVGPDATLPLPTDDPFVQDEAPCRVDRDQARPVSVRAGGNTKTGGPLTLRLRDVDLTDVFQAVHLATGEGFVVDGDVTGRSSVELVRVTLDEALAALQKQAELRIVGKSPLRRVAVERKSAPAPFVLSGGTPPASFMLKRGEVRDLLAVITDADASLASLGPPGFLGRASVFVKDVALRDLRAALLVSAGLGERVEEGRRILERATDPEGERVPVAATGGLERLELVAHELSVGEFELAGVIGQGDDWTALAYSPTGRLISYKAGARLADGTVRAVQGTDVLLETEDGPLRVLLAAPR